MGMNTLTPVAEVAFVAPEVQVRKTPEALGGVVTSDTFELGGVETPRSLSPALERSLGRVADEMVIGDNPNENANGSVMAFQSSI